jgi:glycerophosphoryl diester phosphodiesterase
MDIRKTAGGDIVVMHDETTGRTCDKDWTVAEKTVSELKTLDAAYRFDPAGDRSFPFRGRGLTIPTLDEALTLFVQGKQPGAIVWIDTKDDEDYPFEENQGLYDRLIELIARHNLWSEAHIEVSSVKEAEALRQRDPRIRVVFWGRRPGEIEEALEYPHYVRIGVPANLAPAVCRQVKASGKKLHVTASRFNRSQWEALLRSRPDSVGTDHCEELVAFLGE